MEAEEVAKVRRRVASVGDPKISSSFNPSLKNVAVRETQVKR